MGINNVINRKSMALNINDKIEEHIFFNKKLVETANLIEEKFKYNDFSVNKESKELNYYFSAYLNTVMTLRDLLNTSMGEEKFWEIFSIKELRHGEFIKESRNASTHDGKAIIDTCIEGKFYLSKEIYRLGQNGKSIMIKAPSQDIKNICKEFSYDLLFQIKQLLENRKSDFPFFSSNEICEVFKKPIDDKLIPNWVKDSIYENKEEIIKSIKKDYNPNIYISSIIKTIDEYLNS